MSDLLTAAAFALALSAAAASASAAPSPPAPPAPDAAPFTSQAMTLKLDRDDGSAHMCPTNGQLTSYQVNAAVDNAPVMVELLGPDHKPLAEKGWSAVAGLRVLPLVLGPVRIVMICASK